MLTQRCACRIHTSTQAVLTAIVSLQAANHTQAKSDICNKIDERIADMSTLRGEIATLNTESANAFIAVNALDSQNATLKSLGESVNVWSLYKTMYGLWVCLNECRSWSFVFVSIRTGKTLAFKHPFRVYVRYTILIPRPK